MKPSCKKLKEFAREEKTTSRQYRKMGFKSQAKDESRHSKFFKKKARKC